MRKILVTLLLLPALNLAEAQNLPTKNLAYEAGFVWYLAGRLSSNLMEFQKASGATFTEREASEQGMQYEILYHRYLVECNGPLPKIAAELAYFDLESSNTAALAYVGHLERNIWPILKSWNSGILVQLMTSYAKGDYGFFPTCIDKGFLTQNKIPGVNSP